MIADALKFLTARLNAHLSARFGDQQDWVRLGGLPVENGVGRNKISITLVSLDNAQIRGNAPLRPLAGATVSVPDQPIEALILVAADFPQAYADGLKLLDQTLAFFHANPVFAKEGEPNIPTGVGKLVVEPVDLSVQDMSALWAAFGQSALPGAAYKLRGLTIQSGAIRGDVSPITRD